MPTLDRNPLDSKFCKNIIEAANRIKSKPVAKTDVYREGNYTGGDNSNKRCFGTKLKLFREFGDFSGNRDTWKFFRETRDNSGTLQKKIGTSKESILKIRDDDPNFRDDLS